MTYKWEDDGFLTGGWGSLATEVEARPPSPAIRVSRSAIADRQLCEQRRFLGYHFLGTGLAPAQEPASLAVGNHLHDWMQRVFRLAMILEGSDECLPVIRLHLREEALGMELRGELGEEGRLAFALAYGWVLVRLPLILEEHRVVSVEEEWAFSPFGDPQVEIPLRMDVILERRSDEVVSTLDFKTLTAFSGDWMEKFLHDLQTLIYTEALESVLGVTGGIQFEGLIKGRRDPIKQGPFAGSAAYGSILVNPYTDKDASEKYGEYKAGRYRHPLTTIRQIIDWIDGLWEHSPEILQGQFPSVPMYCPPKAMRETVLKPVLEAERRFAERLEGADHLTYERTPSACLKYGRDYPCPFMGLCWLGGHENPEDLGFVPRKDHHEVEA